MADECSFWGAQKNGKLMIQFPACLNVARPERFELPTTWFVARYSIHLSYGRLVRRGLFR
jgi:hypothetical protein